MSPLEDHVSTPPYPPPAGPPAPVPPGGYAVPQAGFQPVTKRIPEDQPFMLRASAVRRSVQFGSILLILLLVLACPIGIAVAGSGSAAPLVILLLFLLLFGGLFALQIYLLTSGGPVLAVGPHGLWVKTRPTRGQAIWLPWAAIERIYRRRWLYEKMLCVKPRDPRTGTGLGAFTAVDSGVQQLLFGTGFIAPITFSDKREPEIMSALVHFSAGRCRIE